MEAITIVNNVWGKQAIIIVDDVWENRRLLSLTMYWENGRLLSLTMYGDNGGDLYSWRCMGIMEAITIIDDVWGLQRWPLFITMYRDNGGDYYHWRCMGKAGVTTSQDCWCRTPKHCFTIFLAVWLNGVLPVWLKLFLAGCCSSCHMSWYLWTSVRGFIHIPGRLEDIAYKCFFKWCYIVLVFFGSFVWQLISDAGYQGEITSVATACHQVEVFSRVLRTHLTNLLEGGEECLEEGVLEFAVGAISVTCLLLMCLFVVFLSGWLLMSCYACIYTYLWGCLYSVFQSLI